MLSPNPKLQVISFIKHLQLTHSSTYQVLIGTIKKNLSRAIILK